MSLKLVVVALWAVFLFTDEAQAEELKAYQTVVSLKVLCTSGGPEILMEKLLEGYNEKPVHAMDISTISGLNIQMYITENKNNPTSTVLLHNQSVDKTCIFWSARDYLRTLEVESLPAKTPTSGGGT